jgi:hypothetical protein
VRAWLRTVCETGGVAGWAMSSSFNAHRSVPVLLGGVGVYLASNGLRIAFDRKERKASDDPVAAAIWSVLRMFTTDYFGANSAYRTTVLLPNASGSHLVPVFRYQYGTEMSVPDSTAKFEKHSALAGFAWNRPEKPFLRDNIGPFSNQEQFASYCASELHMKPQAVALLSEHVRQHVRGIYCIGLVDHADRCHGVLSIDSTEPNAFARVSKEKIQRFRGVLSAILESRNQFFSRGDNHG